jgi:hypothetical protein
MRNLLAVCSRVFRATLAVARSCVCAAACVPATCGWAQAQGVSINHDEVRCVIVDRFPVLEARFEPDGMLAQARVLFRAAGSEVWYYVEMKQDQGAFRGILPKPLKTTPRIEYYVEAVDRSLGQARTPDYSAAVVGPGQCAPKLRVAATVASANIPLGSLAPGGTLLPPGFSAAGIVDVVAGGAVAANGAAAGATGATAGGGLSTATLLGVVGAGVVAGGAAIAVSASRSDTASSATPNLTGHWAGSYIFQGAIVCDVEVSLTADLTQSGSNLSGPGTFRTRTSARPDCGIQDVQITLTGSLVGSAVNLTLVHLGCVSAMTGTVSGNTMGGNWTESGCGGKGIWNLTRQ